MIGKRLRHLREKENLSQLALAKKLNMPNQNISNYERNFRTPDFDTLRQFADFFSCSTDYLLGRSDDPRLTEKEEKNVDEEANELLKILESVPGHRREELIRMTKAYIKSIEEE